MEYGPVIRETAAHQKQKLLWELEANGQRKIQQHALGLLEIYLQEKLRA